MIMITMIMLKKDSINNIKRYKKLKKRVHVNDDS